MNDDINTLLEDCAMALVCPRGAFYPDKNFGSRIKRTTDNLNADKLLAYARQALSEFDGVYVKHAALTDNGADFSLLINDMERQVRIFL